ncbi:MAG TPA: DUF721 domain-containing protein [Candidatus Binatia bacterium]|nr:DUF721 domain-containing protein [Candidatus Binatia bacterium]
MKSSGPIRLSSILEQALSRLNLDRRLDDYRIWQAWDEVVGATIARNAQPVRLDGTRLVIAVRTSSWLQELSLLQRELVGRLNERMGREVVRELFFVVGRVEENAPAQPKSRPAVATGTPAAARPGPGEKLGAAPGLPPELHAAFERLWAASRKRK